jgi:hypothetical protein
MGGGSVRKEFCAETRQESRPEESLTYRVLNPSDTRCLFRLELVVFGRFLFARNFFQIVQIVVVFLFVEVSRKLDHKAVEADRLQFVQKINRIHIESPWVVAVTSVYDSSTIFVAESNRIFLLVDRQKECKLARRQFEKVARNHYTQSRALLRYGQSK